MSIKDELEKNSEGDPPEHGNLSLTLLHHSLEMHTLREAAIEASAAATKKNISIYDAHKFKIAWWAAQAAERAAKKKMQAETVECVATERLVADSVGRVARHRSSQLRDALRNG
jgi:hypothetical protein